MRNLFSVLFILLICTRQSQAVHQEERPNILWIVSEDTSPLMGCYGDTFATTPFIDQFAKEAILYENAFAPAPACAPSRSTIITGLRASSMGTENMRSNYPIPTFIRFFPKYLREAGYYTTNNDKKDYNTVDQPNAWDESSSKATYKNRKPGQPFFAVFNLNITHESKIHRKIDKLNHDPKKVPIPPYQPSTREMKHDWALFYDNIKVMDKQVGKLLQDLKDAGLADNTIVFYYSDHGGVLARSKRFIFDSGLKVPLIIRFPEKYKSLAPSKAGSRTDRVVSFEDFAPTVLNLAGVKIPSYMEGTPFLGEKLASEKEYAFAFRGRIDERADFVRSIRSKKYRYVRNFMPQKVYGQHVEYQWQAPSIVSWEKAFKAGNLNMIQSAFWKPKPSEELYDITVDPHNIKNLAGDKAYTSILDQMRKDTREIILKTKDTGFIPEAIKSAISDTGTIYNFARSSAYPLQEILETAEIATTRDARHLKALTKRLTDKNSILRYWAATGCGILGKQALAAQAKLTSLLQDREPAVRTVAAEALYALGYKTNVLPVLINTLQDDNIYVRLQVLTVLESMGQDALPALPGIKQMVTQRTEKKMKAQPSWKMAHDVKIANQLINKLNKS